MTSVNEGAADEGAATKDAFAATVRDYLSVWTSHLDARARDDPRLSPFVAQLRSVAADSVQRGPSPRLEHPSMRFVTPAAAAADGDPALVAAVRRAAETLDWRQTYGGGGLDPALADGMLAAQAAGTYGCFASDRVATGLFLLAPGLYYPPHTHAADEIYYCVSGAAEIRHGVDGEPMSIGAGEYSITPTERLHSLRIGDQPTLLAYAWIGQIICPVWWWAEAEEGGWRREEWRREGANPWRMLSAEPVTDEAFILAHGDEG